MKTFFFLYFFFSLYFEKGETHLQTITSIFLFLLFCQVDFFLTNFFKEIFSIHSPKIKTVFLSKFQGVWSNYYRLERDGPIGNRKTRISPKVSPINELNNMKNFSFFLKRIPNLLQFFPLVEEPHLGLVNPNLFPKSLLSSYKSFSVLERFWSFRNIFNNDFKVL